MGKPILPYVLPKSGSGSLGKTVGDEGFLQRRLQEHNEKSFSKVTVFQLCGGALSYFAYLALRLRRMGLARQMNCASSDASRKKNH